MPFVLCRQSPVLGPRSSSRGIVLIITLWILVILAVVALTFAETMNVEARAAANELSRARALAAAKAGLQRAILAVQSDTSGYASDQSSWALLNSEDDQFPFDDERYDITVTDECGKIDLNSADEQLLAKLPEFTPEMVASILDWRDTDDSAHPDGSESDYYSQLRPPRACANRPFLTLDELLLVKGVSREAYYGPDAGRALSLNVSPPPRTADQPTPLVELLTLYSGDNDLDAQKRERLNINDADAQTLVDGTDGILTETDAQAIVDARQRAASFSSIGQLLQVQGITRDKMQQLADLITTRTHSAQQSTSATPTGAGPTPGGPSLPGTGGPGSGTGGTPQTPPSEPSPIPGLPGGTSMPAASQPTTTSGTSSVTPQDYQAGIININTAPAEILATLDGMTEQAVQAIVTQREKEPFTTRGELLKLTEVTDDIFAQIAERVTVRSSALRVTSIGSVEDGRIRVRLTAVVDLKDSQPKIVYVAEG